MGISKRPVSWPAHSRTGILPVRWAAGVLSMDRHLKLSQNQHSACNRATNTIRKRGAPWALLAVRADSRCRGAPCGCPKKPGRHEACPYTTSCYDLGRSGNSETVSSCRSGELCRTVPWTGKMPVLLSNRSSRNLGTREKRVSQVRLELFRGDCGQRNNSFGHERPPHLL